MYKEEPKDLINMRNCDAAVTGVCDWGTKEEFYRHALLYTILFIVHKIGISIYSIYYLVVAPPCPVLELNTTTAFFPHSFSPHQSSSNSIINNNNNNILSPPATRWSSLRCCRWWSWLKLCICMQEDFYIRNRNHRNAEWDRGLWNMYMLTWNKVWWNCKCVNCKSQRP